MTIAEIKWSKKKDSTTVKKQIKGINSPVLIFRQILFCSMYKACTYQILMSLEGFNVTKFALEINNYSSVH